MMPVFSNPAGFWALLGVPLLVAVHCLQQRSRSERVSTLFLLEALAPESRGGRSWDWWRTSRVFWLQVLAVLLATWVLTEPRWVRGESAQTVVLVLDSAVSLEAFREDAVRAAEAKISTSAGRAARTEWVILDSDPRQPPLYRGPERAAALATLAEWRPRMGTHDYEPVLRLARSLAGALGETWFITDSPRKAPPDQAVASVGRPIANVGFAGVSVAKDEGGWIWRALVKNHTDGPQRREWWFEQTGSGGNTDKGVRRQPQTVDLAAGAVMELGGRFPDGVNEGMLVLAPDEFTVDDRLPLLRSQPKELTVGIALDGDAGHFFNKLMKGIEGVRVVGPGAQIKPALRVGRIDVDETPAAGAAILLPPAMDASKERRLQTAPVVAERDELVADLNWQGLLGPGAENLKRRPGDVPLLWQADTPLVWLRPGDAAANQLVLNLDLDAGNATRLPATVLLLRRFVESVRAARPGFYTDNFDAGARVPVAAPDDGSASFTFDFTSAAGGKKTRRSVSAAESTVLRAPGEAGFFTVSRGDTEFVRGAVQFADARQSDFRNAETFDSGRGPETRALWERSTRPDPFTRVWLVILGGLLLGIWWPFVKRGGRAQ
jgi:hypothetical protein